MATPYREFEINNYKILVGKSAKNNDELTTKIAKDTDLWLHVNRFPGSHVVIISDGTEIPQDIIIEAAKLAVRYSKAKDLDKVAVTYTRKINVIKQPNSTEGQVRVNNYKQIVISKDKNEKN